MSDAKDDPQDATTEPDGTDGEGTPDREEIAAALGTTPDDPKVVAMAGEIMTRQAFERGIQQQDEAAARDASADPGSEEAVAAPVVAPPPSPSSSPAQSWKPDGPWNEAALAEQARRLRDELIANGVTKEQVETEGHTDVREYTLDDGSVWKKTETARPDGRSETITELIDTAGNGTRTSVVQQGDGLRIEKEEVVGGKVVSKEVTVERPDADGKVPGFGPAEWPGDTTQRPDGPGGAPATAPDSGQSTGPGAVTSPEVEPTRTPPMPPAARETARDVPLLDVDRVPPSPGTSPAGTPGLTEPGMSPLAVTPPGTTPPGVPAPPEPLPGGSGGSPTMPGMPSVPGSAGDVALPGSPSQVLPGATPATPGVPGVAGAPGGTGLDGAPGAPGAPGGSPASGGAGVSMGGPGGGGRGATASGAPDASGGGVDGASGRPNASPGADARDMGRDAGVGDHSGDVPASPSVAGPGPGGTGGQPAAGAASQPAWQQAADDLGRGATTPSEEPITAGGSRGDAPSGAPGGIGAVGTRPTDIPAGNDPTSSTRPTHNDGIQDDTDFESTELHQGVLGYVWVDDGNGGKTAIDPKTGLPAGSAKPAGEPGADTGTDGTNPNEGTTDDDGSAEDDETDGGEPTSDGDDTGTAWTDDEVAGTSGASGTDTHLGGFDDLLVSGGLVIDGRFTNAGDPNGPLAGRGPLVTGPTDPPEEPGGETPRGDTSTEGVDAFDPSKVPGFGITTVDPGLAGRGPELDPTRIDHPGQTGGEQGGARSMSDEQALVDPTAHGDGIDTNQGLGLGSGPGGIDTSIELADDSNTFDVQLLVSTVNLEVSQVFEIQDPFAESEPEPEPAPTFEIQDFHIDTDSGSSTGVTFDGPGFSPFDMPDDMPDDMA